MLKQFKHLGLVLEEVAVYRWGTHFVSAGTDRELSIHWVYFFIFHLQNCSSECYLLPGLWGEEVVDIGAIPLEGDHLLFFLLILLPIIHLHNHFLKSWRNKWRWHFKYTNCAYRRYLKGHSCRNMPPLVEKNVQSEFKIRHTECQTQGTSLHHRLHQPRGGAPGTLGSSSGWKSPYLTAAVVTLLTSESKPLSASSPCVFGAVVWRVFFFLRIESLFP